MNGLPELYGLAEQEGIQVDSFEMKKAESLSIMDIKDGSCYIAINPLKLTDEKDEKMRLAHEMGHCMTGSFYNEYTAYDIRQKHENSADKWAIEELIPVESLDDAVAQGYTDIWALAEYFDVSVDFMRKAVCWYTYGNMAVNLYF